MTSQEKLDTLKTLLHEYAENEGAFVQPPEETAQQKQLREDLRMVVEIVFKEEAALSPDLSVAELKARMQKIWEKTKPEEWR
jgi:hypothetical protein